MMRNDKHDKDECRNHFGSSDLPFIKTPSNMPFGNNWSENGISTTDSARDGSCEKSPRKFSMDSLYGPAWDAGYIRNRGGRVCRQLTPRVAIKAARGEDNRGQASQRAPKVVGVEVGVAELRATTTSHQTEDYYYGTTSTLKSGGRSPR